MDKFEKLILRWICLFDNFKDNDYSSILNLISSSSFKEFVNDVFCFKCSIPAITEDEKLYKTLKVNYQEFEVQKYEDLYNEGNSVYVCVTVLLHALLKCTDNKFRNQLSERMNNEEQVLLATFLGATQSVSFTKKNISEALLLLNDTKDPTANVSEVFSTNVTPVKSKTLNRSYLQEFCESPKSQSLIYQEKEKLIAKLNEEYKNECEENYKLVENIKTLQDMNSKLSNKLEDKNQIIKCLKDEIEELTKPKKQSPNWKAKNDITIKKLNQDILDLEMNNIELKQQISELENKHKDLNGKFDKKNSDYESLLSTFDNIVAENMSIKENLDSFKETLKKKDVEITSLKDELYNKSVPNIDINSSTRQEETALPSNTLFDELSCIKLEEVTHDKEKYRHKYKSLKKDLSNTEKHVKNLDEQIITLKQQLHDSDTCKNDLINQCSDKKKELQECRKKVNNLETKIKHLKDSIKDKEISNKSLMAELNKKENQIKELTVEMDTLKKAKVMIELILSKTNTEIEALHEENNKYVKQLQDTIEDFKTSEEISQKSIIDLENNIKSVKEDLANKENIIIFYEDKMAENYQTISTQEEQLKTMYHEKLMLENHLKDMKTEMDTRQKMYDNKNRDMESCLEYHLDEIKDVKSNISKVEEIARSKQNEIDRQLELINYQKDIIETLQSEKCSQDITKNDLNNALQQKITENIDLKEKIQEMVFNLKTFEDQLKAAINEKKVLEKELENNKVLMKKSTEEYQCQITSIENTLKSRNNEINQYKIDFEKVKNALEKKQNEFNDQLIESNKQIEMMSHLRLEKYELEEKLKSSSHELLDKSNKIQSFENKLVQNELKIKNLSEEIVLKISENNLLMENLNLVTSTMQNDFDEQLFSMINNLQIYDDKMVIQTNKLSKLKHNLCLKMNELETQIDLNNKQKESIFILESEKHDLKEKCKDLEQTLLNKDIEIENLDKELQSRSLSIKSLEEQLGVMRIEKVMIETNLNETAEQFKQSQEHFIEQINNILIQLNNRDEEIVELKNQTMKTENILKIKQEEIDDQLKLTSEKCEIIKTIKSEKDILENRFSDLNENYKTALAEIKSLNEKLNEHKSFILKLEEELDSTKMQKFSLETRLKENICKKEVIDQEFNEQLKNVENCLKYYSDENNDLKNCLTELKNDLNKKQIEFENITEENNKFKETIESIESKCIDLQDKLKVSNDCILKKNEDIKLLEKQNSEYLIANCDLDKQIIEVKQTLNDKHVELEKQIEWCNEQRESIVKKNCEIESVSSKIKNLEDALSHKEYEFNLSEGKLYDCSVTINNLEVKLDEIKNEKISLEVKLNETISQLSNTNENLTQQLDIKEKKLLQVEEELINKQNELEKQIQQSNEQIHKIHDFNSEMKILLEDVIDEEDYNKQLECSNKKECTLKSLQKEKNIYEKQHEDLQTLKMNLESKLRQSKIQLTNLRQESKQELEAMEYKFVEVQKQLDEKQVEINEHINKSICQIETIATLTSERDNLINETHALKNTVLHNENVITDNQKKILEYEKQNNNLKTEKNALEIELKQTNKQLDTTNQDLSQKLEEMEKKLSGLQERLDQKQVDLETQVKETSIQVKVVSTLVLEKDNLLNEINTLKNSLLDKENALISSHEKQKNFEKQLKEVQTQKMCVELELNEMKVKFDNNQHDICSLETKENKLIEMQEQLKKMHNVLDEKNKFSNEQINIIDKLTSANNNLVVEMSRLKQLLVENECALASHQDKLQCCEKQNQEIICQKTALVLELNQLKSQLNNLHQESTKQIIEMDNKLCEVQDQLNLKQSELKKQVELKHNSLEDICQKINDLKNIKNELETAFKNESKDFETGLEACSNYSTNFIKSEPIQDDHQESLMEVITSADTFIEQNGIQLAKIDNYDQYSIIERLKKLFEALKMFIININTQGSQRQAVLHIDNECSSEEYADLLAKSKTQVETINRLETEMAKLRAECNYKMTKVQQKTQEYVTSEYEKKFERKREQMKQFCKDLETKIHQDYEAKLKKYKEKINIDEIHIKELGQQLWEVSEKYLKLQQKERRESTMSLPFDMSTASQNQVPTLPNYSSYTLPKSSSAGQIRSMIEESTRSYRGTRNVPSGIGKKFSLSSGKIFPKEEDEEGEMFNHSCLSDLKQGKVRLNDNNDKLFNERLSELQARNSLCPPHLRSCYAVETNYLPNASLITEENIKTLANFSDCESENLIPNDRTKKKDRNQTSYKKPGPPTPSKNGGRVSLTGNTKITLKEPKDSNSNKRRTSSTPNKLFSLFMSKK